MPKMSGFWSYVHKDDDVEMGRVSALAKDIANNYEAIRAEEIELFLDSDGLHWGDDWRAEINESLGNVAFFVPVLTPRYFRSPECRRELQFFLDRTAVLGISQLVMPILYIDVPELVNEESEDPLVRAVIARQWRDWRSLRFEERASGAYRAAVHELATEIATRALEAESADVAAAAAAAVASGTLRSEEEPPGLIDRVVALEEVMPRWGETLSEISTEIANIGKLVESSTKELRTAPGKGFAARLVVARRLAADLEEPVSNIESLARGWLGDLDAIDSGIRVLIELSRDSSEADRETTKTFLNSILSLSGAANGGLGKTMGMVDSLGTIAEQSRDLRPLMRRLQSALTSMTEARILTDQWADLAGEIQTSLTAEQP